MDEDETWHRGMPRALGQGHIVLDGDPAPPPQKGHSPNPNFGPYVCCVQTAEWIKMPLGMEHGYKTKIIL